MAKEFGKIINKDNLDNAKFIWNMIEQARKDLWNNFIVEFESQMAQSIDIDRIPDKTAEYWFKQNELNSITSEPISIGLVFKEKEGIKFCLFVGKGIYKDERYYNSHNYKLDDFKNDLPTGICIRNDIKLPWLYREEFPKFGEEKINFGSMIPGTTKLLLKENRQKYVSDFFIPRIKQLTGWGTPENNLVAP